MTKTRKQTETAAQAYERNRREAQSIAKMIFEKMAQGATTKTHWGDVGDVSEVLKNLKQAAHYAGIPGYVEQ